MKTFRLKPTTKSAAAGTRPVSPLRSRPATETEPKNGPDKMKKRAQPRRAVPDPLGRVSDIGEQLLARSPGRSSSDSAILHLRDSKLLDHTKMGIQTEVTTTQERHNPTRIQETTIFLLVQRRKTGSRHGPEGFDRPFDQIVREDILSRTNQRGLGGRDLSFLVAFK